MSANFSLKTIFGLKNEKEKERLITITEDDYIEKIIFLCNEHFDNYGYEKNKDEILFKNVKEIVEKISIEREEKHIEEILKKLQIIEDKTKNLLLHYECNKSNDFKNGV